jgi:hypothetical protein
MPPGHAVANRKKNDPVLLRYARQGALAEARDQIAKLDRGARAKLTYEFIDQHVSMAMADGCTRKQAISFAMERFGVSERTVEKAIAYMDERGRAPRADRDGLEDF